MIIWGSRGITSSTSTGEFHCPRCGPSRTYAHQEVRRWFTLYFIPLIPLDKAGEYIECRQCGGTFGVEAKDYDPVLEEQRSLDKAKRTLVATCVRAGNIDRARIEAIQAALQHLTGVHFDSQEIEKEIQLAQQVPINLQTIIPSLCANFTEQGNSTVLAAACLALSRDGRLLAADEPVLRELGQALGMTRRAMDEVLTKMPRI